LSDRQVEGGWPGRTVRATDLPGLSCSPGEACDVWDRGVLHLDPTHVRWIAFGRLPDDNLSEVRGVVLVVRVPVGSGAVGV